MPIFVMIAGITNSFTRTRIRLYADDVIIYRAILSSEDAAILQEDLNKLVSWAATWLMSLNLNKCKHP